MKYRFKRGDIVRSNATYFVANEQSLVQDRTYVVSKREKDKDGHTLIQVIDDRGLAVWFTETSFYKR